MDTLSLTNHGSDRSEALWPEPTRTRLTALVQHAASVWSVNEQRLHPSAEQLVQRFLDAGVPPYEEMALADARASLDAVTRLQTAAVDLARVDELWVSGAHDRLRARLYRPESQEPLPLVIYVHGGGWVLGSLDSADRPCRRLAQRAQCAVLAFEYRRAPETRFPGALSDIHAALEWAVEHAVQIGVNAERPLLVGDSAGGNLVAATAHRLRDHAAIRLAGQALIYPALLPFGSGTFASYTRYGDLPLLQRSTMDWFWDRYLPSRDHVDDVRAAPLLIDDPSALPPTFVAVAGCDVLRDEGLAYAACLHRAQVPVDVQLCEGMPHGFWWMDKVFSQAHALDATLADWIARRLTGTQERDSPNGN